MPVFSLPSRYGIGCLSKDAFEFVDFLVKSGQHCWQILPVGPTGFGNSPYQPFSAFAGNPYFISPEKLIEEGLLRWEEVDQIDFGQDPERVDYGKQYEGRAKILQIASDRFTEQGGRKSEEYLAFLEVNADWLDDYCLFMALKDHYEGKSWLDWDSLARCKGAGAPQDSARKLSGESLREGQDGASSGKRPMEFWSDLFPDLAERIGLYRFEQFEFEKEWDALHKYATEKGIRIIGDIPFYVSLDSADVWANPDVFRMTEDFVPEVVAGCPPDAFLKTGQLWGNPIYDWKALKKTGYGWWMKRIERNRKLFDVIRIDHFLGFNSFYAVPYTARTAESGTLEKGPGMDFFRVMKETLGDVPIIAEDLGEVTEEGKKLLADTGFPGMKVLQFAFTSWDSIYLPYRHTQNSVVYTGTHDNPTTRSWIEQIPDGSRDYVRRYIHSENTDYGAFTWDFIREAYRSVADLCIIPLTDYLVKGDEARINTPGSSEGNWEWRLRPNFLSEDLARSIRGLSELYGRAHE